MADEVSVNLILVSGTGYNVSYLVQGREVDKSDLYVSRPELFKPGSYPFYWPGNVSFFGGGIEDGETPQAAFKREVMEETGLDLTDDKVALFKMTTYRWVQDTHRIIAEANEAFQGHVPNFLGFSLNERLPNSALNKRDRDRYGDKPLTYQDWIFDRETDHYLAANIGESIDLPDNEGAGSIWVPHWVARSICMVPIDKIALLDDMTQRIRSGELEIKVKRA